MSENNTNQIFSPGNHDLSDTGTDLVIIDRASGAYEPPSPDRPMSTYPNLDKAGEHLSSAFFESRLKPCLITLERRVNTYGSFSIASVANVNNSGEIADKIMLSARHVPDMTDLFIVSCVLRQMVGIWQHHEGNPGRSGFYNCEWYEKMRSVGLQPYAVDKHGNWLKGRKSGERFHHEVIANGAFDLLSRSLLSSSNNVLYLDRIHSEESKDDDSARARERKVASKTRYHCARDNLNAWAKPGVRLICGACGAELEAC